MTRPKYAEENNMTVINGVWVTENVIQAINYLKTEMIPGAVLSRGQVVAKILHDYLVTEKLHER